MKTEVYENYQKLLRGAEEFIRNRGEDGKKGWEKGGGPPADPCKGEWFGLGHGDLQTVRREKLGAEAEDGESARRP